MELVEAVQKGEIDVVNNLVQKNVDLNEAWNETTPLHECCRVLGKTNVILKILFFFLM